MEILEKLKNSNINNPNSKVKIAFFIDSPEKSIFSKNKSLNFFPLKSTNKSSDNKSPT